ncbi:PAS-domain containing protein [Sphingomonas sp. 4RDLI-65]|uniref:hybrid sensor histidine kinase/response regulator n=1 Tax=Sphingomonas sp. 4RDLI-65 TaxID=3111641 RepID=UPI003C21E057
MLFGIAWVVDRRGLSRRMGRIAYPLSLAVYCSSWTFFGGVGTAATRGWDYLAIYLGPVLVFLLAPKFLARLVRLAREEGSSSISDFISARYGRSRGTAAIVAGTALLASVPYIALQLRSVTLSFGAIAGVGSSTEVGVLVALLLAVFAILFGARRYEVAGRNPGVVAAIAAESLIKLLCFVVLGVVTVALLADVPAETLAAPLTRLRSGFTWGALSSDFWVRTLLSALAILCLPRQFYVGVIEARGPDAIARARGPFIAYMVAISLLVLPLALAGMTLLPGDAEPDLYVLAVPLEQGKHLVALIAFIGGFSAATAMVVVETIALSTMATNDLLAPLLLRRHGEAGEGELGRRMLRVRRVIIAAIVAVALLYGRSLGADLPLASIGLIAFAGVAQFAPALIATVGWDFANHSAARAGLIGGVVVWIYCLLLPSIGEGVGPALAQFTRGWLDPDALLGWRIGSPLVNGTVWSLGVNIALIAGLHFRERHRGNAALDHVTTLGELRMLVARFVGDGEAEAIGLASPDLRAPIDGPAARTAERLIAGVIGAPSARKIVASSIAGSAIDVSDVVRLLDQRGRSLRFSRTLLSATLETIDPGVSVIDADLRLVAWNPRYVEMFDYPEGYVVVGRAIADLIRYNAEREGVGDIAAHVGRRVAHLARGTPHSFERQRPSGRWIKMVGRPMPGGGYVQSFTDITAEKEAQADLEARVVARTQDLARSNHMLDEARAVAETATRDKTRFLAAASHDLLQPLHAARLFCAALDEGLDEDRVPHQGELVRAIDGAIGSADTLLRALLDVSRLDAGGVVPKVERFALGALIEELAVQFAPLAGERGLVLVSHPGAFSVATDRSLLRSILQNFLSNAVRYSADGRIWIGARRRGDDVLIEVRDAGPGIAAGDRERIFEEFERLESKGSAGGGVGLGLAIVRRIARLLGVAVELRSAPGRGTTFAVRVPLAPAGLDVALPTPSAARALVPGLRVLCLDNDATILSALDAALRARRCVPLLAATVAEAMELAADEEPDVALVDYHLDEAEDGLDVVARLRAMVPAPAIALVTADRAVVDDPRCAGLVVLTKPVVPADLWRFIEEASAAAARIM